MITSSLSGCLLAMKTAAGQLATLSRVPMLTVLVVLVAAIAGAEEPAETEEKEASEESIAWVEGQVLINGIPVPGLVVEFDSNREGVKRKQVKWDNPTAVTDGFGTFAIPKPEEDADAKLRLVPGKYAVRLWATRGDVVELRRAYEADNAEEAADEFEEVVEEAEEVGDELADDADGFQQVPADFNSKSSLEFEIVERSNSIMINIDVDAEVAGALAEQAEAAMAEAEGVFMAPNNPFQQMGVMDPAHQFLVRYAKVRCSLLRRCCEVSEEQNKELENLTGDWLKEAVENASKKQGGGVVMGIARFLGGAAAPAAQPMQPHEVIGVVRTQFDKEINEILAEDQAAALNAEVEAWQEFRNDALAKLMIASIDRRLFLSTTQREELLPDVRKWVGKKNPYWQFYFQNSNYVPDIPSSVLRKHLDEEQRAALQGMQKYMYEADQMEWQMMNNNGAVIFLEE